MKLGKRPDVQAHPAEYSVEVLEIIREIVPRGATVLDHMAGTGWRLAETLSDCKVIGIELEPEWAEAHPCVQQGNALALPFKRNRFKWVVNSPTFGNRMADHHNAQERCKPCKGTGRRGTGKCSKCGGVGRRDYVRMTYRHKLGRKLHEDNSGQLQWGEKYRDFHRRTNDEVWRVLAPGGRFVLNIKNHLRTVGKPGERRQEEQLVAEWWVEDLTERLGFELEAQYPVSTPGMRNGQNRDARVLVEWVYVFRKPDA